MSTILTETEGFTPVIDVLAQELGLMTAVVYGIVWRYCQMENKVCSASRETIAERANISVKTVDRHLDKLCEAGYLKDLHPDWKHRPHIYADTGKLKIEALVKVRRGETDSPTLEEGGTESPTTETQSPTGETESLTGETESPTKIPSYDSSYDSQLGKKDADVFPEKEQTDEKPSVDHPHGRDSRGTGLGDGLAQPVAPDSVADELPDWRGDSIGAGVADPVVEAIIAQTETHPGPEDLQRATVAKREEAGNYAAPPSAGGDDGFQRGPVDAFCEVLAGVTPALLPPKKRQQWAQKLRQIAEEWSTEGAVITAQVVERAIRAVPDDCDIGWKTYKSPYAGKFDEEIGPLLLSGGKPRQKGAKHGPHKRNIADGAVRRQVASEEEARAILGDKYRGP